MVHKKADLHYPLSVIARITFATNK